MHRVKTQIHTDQCFSLLLVKLVLPQTLGHIWIDFPLFITKAIFDTEGLFIHYLDKCCPAPVFFLPRVPPWHNANARLLGNPSPWFRHAKAWAPTIGQAILKWSMPTKPDYFGHRIPAVQQWFCCP